MEQNWEKLLKGIITLQSETGLDNWDRYYDNEKIYEVSGLEQGEIGPAKAFLEERGLIRIEQLENGTREIIVDEEGFAIAREQEYRESQKRSNKIIALFTIILGASTTLNLAVQVVDSLARGHILIWQAIIVIVTIIAIVWLVNRSDFFSDL